MLGILDFVQGNLESPCDSTQQILKLPKVIRRQRGRYSHLEMRREILLVPAMGFLLYQQIQVPAKRSPQQRGR